MNAIPPMVGKIIFAATMIVMLNGVASAADKWVACGDDQLRFYEMRDGSIAETERINWSDLTIPKRFSAVDDLNGIVECKPAGGGQQLLVASWRGGVARVDISTRTVNFSAHVPHAHSATLLPRGRIVAVGETLRVFDENDGDTPLIELDLQDGHGVSWDAENEVLYVLSEDFIEEFKLENWDTPAPELRATAKTRLPGQRDGHDLMPAQKGLLLVSTRDGVWHFDPADRQFTAHAEMNPLPRAQSVAETDDALVWVQAEESWWGRGFFVKPHDNAVRRVATPEIRLYKVRNLSR